MNLFSHPGFVLRICIAAGYIVLSIFLFLRPYILSFLTTELTYGFSVVLLLYGFFRIYRAYEMYKNDEI